MTKETARIILGLCLAIGVIIGASAAILASRKDAGFLPCELGGEMVWPANAVPLEVYLDAADLDWEEPLLEAIDRFNDVAPLFVYGGTYDPIRPPIAPAVLVSAEMFEEAHGRTHLTDAACTVVRADVVLPGLVDEMQERIVAHELGHALGLDHDDNEGSVMFDRVDPRFRDFEISDADRALLRKTYGNGTTYRCGRDCGP